MKKISITLLVSALFTSQFIFADHPAEILCDKTIHNYAISRDALDPDGYAAAFTEEAVFITPSLTYSGRKEIRQYINSQPKDIGTIHHITTRQIQPLSNSSATGTVYSKVSFYKVTEGISHIYQEANAVYQDRYRLHKNRCEIVERRLKILTLDQVK